MKRGVFSGLALAAFGAFFLLMAPVPAARAYPADATRAPLEFSLHKKETGKGPTLMVVGGIQGDEPGAFSAASLLVTHYDITHGNVWIVPNLNVLSMVRSSRGTRGDLNRKFARIAPNDPDMPIIARIKPILLDESVDLILNMHDGSGFYRPTFQSAMRNPRRWGQSIIIDQATLPGARYPQLEKMAAEVAAAVNRRLLKQDHLYHVKNTRTAEGDLEMAKTLTYFALTNGKAAFGQEVSKDFDLPTRVYYHLLVLEAFMKKLGIGFERRFALNPAGILAALGRDVNMSFEDGRFLLSLDNVRNSLRFIPQNEGAPLRFSASSPILTVVDEKKDGLHVYYGNRRLTRLSTFSTPFDDSLAGVTMTIDGHKRHVPFGSVVSVSKHFAVEPLDGYRVNAIGATVPGPRGDGSECGVRIQRKDFAPAFSLDKGGTLFRIEVYRKENALPDREDPALAAAAAAATLAATAEAGSAEKGGPPAAPAGKPAAKKEEKAREAFSGMILVRFGGRQEGVAVPAAPQTPKGR